MEICVQAVDRVAPRDRRLDDPRFEQIIGSSPALESVLEQIQQVGPTDSTVLVQGETGTGKELVARAIHRLSARCGRSFVKLNCAAIPLDLLESELFGHEQGAFTGAIAKRIGRFEAADRGTLLLDEVGDIPPAIQPKLLRVLQEQEFERLGSTHTHRVDVRVIAATNRDLADMVKRGAFRIDLYYRLNVFPIQVPALRQRRQDIPALVGHLVETISRKMGKRIDDISQHTMAALQAYDWPGNIRELQNAIERAVILADRGVLPNPLPPAAQEGLAAPAPTFNESERTVILNALESVGWVVGGPRGAAARLGVHRTTLINKMKRLRISQQGPDDASYLAGSNAEHPESPV
jgi:formate hydrogenlyase transcriptional activator